MRMVSENLRLMTTCFYLFCFNYMKTTLTPFRYSLFYTIFLFSCFLFSFLLIIFLLQQDVTYIGDTNRIGLMLTILL